ncbi:MAG: DUF2877 domain-containing protein [Enterovibrio sp.]
MSASFFFAQRGCDSVKPNAAMNFVVHSRFARSCNLLSAEGRWLTILAQGMALPPAGIVLTTPLLPDDLQVAQRWALHQQRLQGPTSSIILESCQWISTRLPAGFILTAAAKENLLAQFEYFLPLQPPEDGFWWRLHGADEIYLQEALAKLQYWLKNGDLDALGWALKKLLGYGAGLTPSGDDFLLGVMFILQLANHPLHADFCANLLPQLTKTSPISAHLLQAATQGHFGEHLGLLCGAASEDLIYIIQSIAEHGHSSGHDTLCGIRFALACLAD